MTTLSRILCAVDLSEFSRHALEHAALLAATHRARVTVLHAYTTTPAAAAGPMPVSVPLPPDDPARRRDEVERFCAASRLPADVALEIVVLKEPAVTAITRTADERNADLIVLGTHGRSGFERLLLGSVTEKVLRSTHRPVLTIPPPAGAAPKVYETILCAIDFSDTAAPALAAALSLAGESSARLVLLHVIEPFPDQFQATGHVAALAPDERARLAAETTQALTALVPADAHDRRRPETLVAFGKASREIVRVAAETRADLIVLAVHGRDALDRWMFGSTTPRVIREATAPVLTIRA